jgi:hypothetical protein
MGIGKRKGEQNKKKEAARRMPDAGELQKSKAGLLRCCCCWLLAATGMTYRGPTGYWDLTTKSQLPVRSAKIKTQKGPAAGAETCETWDVRRRPAPLRPGKSIIDHWQ